MAVRRSATPVLKSPIQGLSDDYLTCRDRSLGHDWDRLENFKLDTPGSDRATVRFTRRCRCTRCGTIRIERFAHADAGEYARKLSTSYTYPEGYQMKGITARMVWAEEMRRAGAGPAKKKAAPARRRTKTK